MRSFLRFSRRFSLVFALGAAAAAPACSSSPAAAPATSPLCTGAGRCVVFAAGAKESDIAAAFATVKDGDTIVLGAGTYTFTNQLALGAAGGVSILGAGIDATVLDFHGQKAGEDALFAQSVSDLRFEGFSVKDSPGNAIKVLGVTGVTFRSVGVSWTAGDSTDGAYGLYPVQSTNVLIERCKISGASDSGIYVGQSRNIVARNNEAFGNVAGIEMENSFDADVHDNDSHDNTAGILVFDLPGLQQEGGHSIRVYANTITGNNTANFAASGDVVSMVPAGVGFFVMANHDVEVFQNTFTGNQTAAAGIVSYAITQLPITDPNYYQWPSKAYVHDNTYSGNGLHPDVHTQIGLLLLTGLSAYPQGHAPDVFWDGIADPAAPAGSDPMELCVGEPTATVCNGHFDKLDSKNPDLSKTVECDAAPFACTRPALPAVTWPGLTP